MKTKMFMISVLSFLALASWLSVFTVSEIRAERATEGETERVCQNWLTYMVFQKGAWSGEIHPQIVDADDLVEGDTVLARCFSIAPRGYVVVPILKELPPVKAYSEEYVLDVDQRVGFPQLLREVLLHRVRLYVKTYGSLDAVQPPTGDVLLGREHKAAWNPFLKSEKEFEIELTEGKFQAFSGLGPLLKTSWHQRSPYNDICPPGDGGICLVGCVATAAAQIMKYWNWPSSGSGSHSYLWDGDQSCGGSTPSQNLSATFSDPYDWSNMPDSCDYGCARPEESAALAELCYEVGVAFDMDYGYCGSGAYTSDALSVFPTYFRYDSSIDRENRDQHTAQTWFDLIKAEINERRPMQYRIRGHSIVCDGWMDTGWEHLYHINYGWAGPHTVWFAIDNIYGSQDPMEEYLIRNIFPDTEPPNCEDINPDPELGVLQIDSWGMTYYDEQQVGSMGRMIAVGPDGHRGMVFHETDGPFGPAFPMHVTYNCKDPYGMWLGPTWIDGGPGINAGYPNIGVMHDGREMITYHTTAEIPNKASKLAVGDSGYMCTGYFTNRYDLPDELGATEEGMWPKMGIVYEAVADTDYIHIVMTEATTTGINRRLGYVRSHLIAGDNLLCEWPVPNGNPPGFAVVPPNTPTIPNPKVAHFGEVGAPGVPPDEYPNIISVVVATSPVSQKVAIVFTNKREPCTTQVNNDLFYFESSNNGMEWFPQFGGKWPPREDNHPDSCKLHNVTNYPTDATERAYTDVAACYDYNDHLHIVWTSCYFDSASGEVRKDANLMHWCDTDPLGFENASLVATGYWEGTAPPYWVGTAPGCWNRNISKMSISAQDPIHHPPDSVYLYCTWTQFNPGDLSLGRYTNGDVYVAVSNDVGQSWTPGFNLANTPTNIPGCMPGECLSEHWSSLAENMYDGDLHIEYVCDRDAGAAVRDEGRWTDNDMMYVHVAGAAAEPHCGISYSLVEPTSFTTPPVKVPLFPGSRTVTFQIRGIHHLGGDYQVTSDNPKVAISGGTGHLSPGESNDVQATITCTGEEFIQAIITIRGCVGTTDEDTTQIPLYAVCSDDYYECDRDPATFIQKDNCTLRFWTCVNMEQRVWDKRIEDEHKQQVLFSGGVIVATSDKHGAVVGRQDYSDVFTGARDTINVVQGYDYFQPQCDIQLIHIKNTYIWTPPPIPSQPPKWWWIDIHEKIIFFHDRPDSTCPEWKKEQIIKKVWIDWSPPPGWWPDPGVYEGHEDIYLGFFADVDAPWDYGCYRCNTAGYDNDRELIWQHGSSDGTHPEYEDHYVGLTFTDPTGAVVAPFGCQNVLNEHFLYPQDGWGWNGGELYQLVATPGVKIHHPDSVADRTVVMTADWIPAGDDSTFWSHFMLIEASIQGDPGQGLTQLQQHIDSTRNILIPELAQLGLLRQWEGEVFPPCGDVTRDGAVLINDAIYIITYLFGGGPPPPWPFTRGDPTGDCVINVADVIYLITYLFAGGPPPTNCCGFGR